MKKRFEEMTLDQLDAIREVMCYLYPPMESIQDETANHLFHDLEDVRLRKMTEYNASEERRRKREESDALYRSLFIAEVLE